MESSLLIESAVDKEESARNRTRKLRARVVGALTSRRRFLVEIIGCSGFLLALFSAISVLAFLLTLVPVGGFTDAPAIANTLYASLAYQFPSVRKFLAEVPPPPPPLAASMDLALSPPPPV